MLVVTLSPWLVAETPLVSCWDNLQQQKGYGKHVWRSNPVSGAEGQSAYVETEARPVNGIWSKCVNTSRLFVRFTQNLPFEVVYITRPDSNALGNTLELLGWSGSRLLLNDNAWQYESDAAQNQVIIYDVSTGIVVQPQLGTLVSTELRLKCGLGVSASRWVGQRVEFRVFDPEADFDAEGDGCLQGKSKGWLFDLDSGKVLPKK